MHDRLEAILADDYLGDLSASPMDEIRSRRASCQTVETGLSYLRRLAQGHLDVVEAELARRREGGGPEALEELIARLPELLAARTRNPGGGRLTADFGTGEVDPDLQSELDALVKRFDLDSPDRTEIDALEQAAAALTDLEHRISALRRRLFDQLDLIEAELTRRYRTGEATVDGLLH